MKNKLSIFVFLSVFAMFFAAPVLSAHNNSAQIEPEWSTAGVEIDYTVTICNVYDGNDSIDEVRLYETTGYNITVADSKTGWYKSPYNPVKKYYQYTATDPSYYIDAGDCTDFTFTAITPEQGDLCDLQWKFETRDINDVWKFAYDNTSVDELPPEITKEVIGPQQGPCPPGQGEECWVMDHETQIVVQVEDKGSCQPPSGIDYCTYTIELDDQGVIFEHTFNPAEPEPRIGWVVNFTEDSVHTLTIFCKDVAGNNVTDIEVFRVDSTPPITTKTYGTPHYPPNINVASYPHWITTHTPITLDAQDGGPICAIGVDKTWYLDTLVPDEYCRNEEPVLNGYKMDMQVDFCYPVCETPYVDEENTACIASAQEWCTDHWQGGYAVDTLQGWDSWEDCVEDYVYEECNIYCRWNDQLLKWKLYREGEPIYKNEQSCHLLEYQSVDNIGNVEELKYQCVFVEDQPPRSVKEVGDPKIEGDHNPLDWWVTQNTNIRLDCTDPEPHPVDHEQMCFKVALTDEEPATDLTEEYCDEFEGTMNGEGYCCVYVGGENDLNIHFLEDSNHRLDYYCVDALKNDERTLMQGLPHTQYYKVDTAYPTIEKLMLGVEGEDYLGDCPPQDESDDCYVADNGVGGVNVKVRDYAEPCAVGVDYCGYGLWWLTDEQTCIAKYGPKAWDGSKCLVDSGRFINETDIIFHEDSRHKLYISCFDELGNEMPTDIETFLVDSTPPETTKAYGTPFQEDGNYHWITSATPITLTATDNKVGVKNVTWRVTPLFIPDEGCVVTCNYRGSGAWNTAMGNTTQFTIPQQSCHLIEFYSADRLGNTEGVKHQCVFVDNTPPETTKVVGQPQVACEGDECDYYITQQTPITLRCTDGQPHPVDHVSLSYRYRVSNDCVNWGNWTAWIPYGNPFTFPEDSCHQLQYYCKDILGNTEVTKNEIDIVDTVPPVITTAIEGPKAGDCPELKEGDECFIDGVTNITVTVVDPQPHPVNDITCRWAYTVDGGQPIIGGQGLGSTFKVHFPEESRHFLTIQCVDGLGNKVIKNEYYSVDKIPPVTTKLYTGPQYPPTGGYPKWITSGTEISLSVEDAGPHKSGIKDTFYRVTLVADENCRDQKLCAGATGTGTWISYEDPFTIGEESCHLIEYYSVDNVDKTETVNKQCVFVDNSVPVPNKTVGEPKEVWDGLDANFYDLEEFCATPGNCWKVTILTPISLECIDAQPHPVDHETVCFKVGLDGKDNTTTYCDKMDGTMKDGYCCLAKETKEFHFNEVSEHNLAYYCKDALGNTGPIDDEKFKVEDTAFEIQINPKWNLISTPVVLLDGAMNKIFDSDANCTPVVKSVWTYDAVTGLWHVYTPDGNDMNDDLDTMVPGDGYWVLSNDSCLLTIGGSLMSPATLPPSKEIATGWNLIGYYGADGQTGYYGPAGNGKTAKCNFKSLLPTDWINPPIIWGYWEPYNYNKWIPINEYTRMDPGAGYWIGVSKGNEGIYMPSSC